MAELDRERVDGVCADVLREFTTAGPAERGPVESSALRWVRSSGIADPQIVLWARSPAEARPLLTALQAGVRAVADEPARLGAMAAWEAATRVGRGIPPETIMQIARFADAATPGALSSTRDAQSDVAEPAGRRIAEELGDEAYEALVTRTFAAVGVARAHCVVFVGDALGWYDTPERGQATLRPLPIRWFSPELIDICTGAGISAAADWADWAALLRGVFTAWVFRDAVLLCERPTRVELDPQGRPHSETGPAMRWSDGFELYAWHGTRVPRSLIDNPWPARAIMHTRNAEVRRCAIERIGWERFVAETGCLQIGATVPDPANPGCELSLYDIPFGYLDTRVRVLVCTNASPERDGVRRNFGLMVPPLIADPLAAAAWTFGLSPYEYRELAAAS